MVDDNEEKALIGDQDLTEEQKIEKLEELADEIGLDIEELGGSTALADLDIEGTFTVHLEDEDGNVKRHEEFEF